MGFGIWEAGLKIKGYMRIAIIGAGFTGLTAALRLAQKGHTVVIFEGDDKPGGLAVGFDNPRWTWNLERHYHHIFTSDTFIQRLADEAGAGYFFKRGATSTWLDGRMHRLDSPLNLLKFDGLSIASRIKTGAIIAYLKYLAPWKKLEQETARGWLERKDHESFARLWEPLLTGKFGQYANSINMAWFWGRIKKRSSRLGYFEGGFEELALKIEKKATGAGAKFEYGTKVSGIKSTDSKFEVSFLPGSGQARLRQEARFDTVLVTGGSWNLAKLAPQLPPKYIHKLKSYKGLGAVNLVLSLSKSLLEDGTYWLNINDHGYPFLSVVEQTNLVDRKYYGGNHVVYVGNYLAATHRYFGMSETEILEEFLPFLQKINPKFELGWIVNKWLFKAPFAQPVTEVNHSLRLLPFETPLPGLYWAGMQQVYPWDRGTNYAVEMGEKVAELINKNEK